MRRRNGVTGSIRAASSIGYEKTMGVYFSPPTTTRLTPEEHHDRQVHCEGCEWTGILGDVANPWGEPRCPNCTSMARLRFGVLVLAGDE